MFQIQKLTMSNSDEKSIYGVHSASPPSLSGSYNSVGMSRHRSNTTWLETDLDLMITRDLGVDMPESPLMTGDPMDMYRRELAYDSEVRVTCYFSCECFREKGCVAQYVK